MLERIGNRLQNKLILAVVTITILSVAAIVYFANRTSSDHLTEQQGQNLNLQATGLARSVADRLGEQASSLQVFGLNAVIQKDVARVNATYVGTEAEIRASIVKFDQQWQKATDNDPFILNRISNNTAAELRKYRNQVDHNLEIFITDKYGGIIAETNRTTDYDQSDEDWWQKTWNNGEGAVFIGQPEFDPSVNATALIIAVPLFAHNPNNAAPEVVGVLRTTYDFAAISSLITDFKVGQTGQADLYLYNSAIFDAAQNKLLSVDLADIAQLLNNRSGRYSIIDSFKDRPSLVTQIPLNSVSDHPYIANLVWTVVVNQSLAEALQAATDTTQVILLIGVIVVLLTSVVFYYIARQLTTPIVSLTETARTIASGGLSQRTTVRSKDEIGTLATVFNTMADQLQNLVGTLEERVSARTRDLQIVANVSKSATTILDLDNLLQAVVDLTKQSFNLYHAHIYLLDESGENLALTSGAGEPGKIMKAQGRRIALDNPKSLVARAGRSRKGVIENDVTKAPDFLPNPLLPNTKSELAVPMVVGDRLIGVLDVQGDSANRFTDEDVAVQTSLGDQIAVAVQNARAFAEVQRAEEKVRANQEELLEAQRIARVGRWTWVPATGEVGWNDMMYEHFGEPHHMQPNFDLFLSHVHPEDAPGLVKVMQDAMQSGAETFTHEYRVVRSDGQIRYHAAIGGITRDTNGTPVRLVGTAQDITDRKGVEVERQILSDSATRLNNARERHEVLEAILPYGRDHGAFTASLLYVDTNADNMPEWAELASQWSAKGVSMTPIGTRFYLPELPMSKLWMSNPNEPTIIDDVATNAGIDETMRATIQQTGGHALAILPMTTQGRWIGLVIFSWSEPTTFTEQDQRIFTNLMQQATATVDALRSAEETLIALAQTETLYVGSERIAQATSYDEVLMALVETTPLQQMDRVSLGFFNRIWTDEQPESMTIASLWTRNGDTSSGPVGTVYPLDRFPITKYMKRNAPLVIRNTEKDKHVDDNTRALLGRLGMRSMLAFPIVANSEWIGTLTSQNNEVRLLSDDEIRQINALTDQAATKIQSIRLLDETRKRAAELETVAKVSAAATTILNLDELLQSVVDLTKQSFDLYHAHIYLLDEAGERLVLTSGAGEPGRVMKAQGRAILLSHPNSLVARAGRTRQGAIANDVTKDPDFLANPLLPNTKSELAVPMVVNDRLVGVLDVQADRVNRFSEEDVAIQTTLADQIAVAVENARAFTRIQETEEAVREREQRYQQILDGVRDLILVKGEKSRIVWANKAFRDYYGMSQEALLGMIDAPFVEPDFTQQYIIDDAYVFDNGVELEVPEEPVERYDGTVRLFQTVKTPIFDQNGKVFLTVGVSRDITDRKEIEAERQIGYEVASRLNEAQNRQHVLEATLPYPQRSGIVTANLLYIDADHNNNPTWAETAAIWAKAGTNTSPVGSRYYLPEFPIAKLWMSSPNEPLLIGDLNSSSIVDETTRQMMQATGVQAMAILPMLTQGSWIAVMSFSWSETVQFSDQDRRVYTSMMQQATATVDALRSAEETQQAREDAEILYRVSTLVNEAQTEQDIVNAIVQYAIPGTMTSASLNLNEGGDYENASYTEVVASWRPDGTSNTGMRIPLAGFSDGSSDPRAMTVINDVKNELPEAVHSAYEAFGVGAIVTMPLMIGGRVIGSLSLSGPNAYYFSNREIQMWRAISEQTATTMERFFLTRQTTRRAAELQTVAQVSAAATMVLEVEPLLQSVVDLTKESFNLYHAHVYLTDEAGENLVLAAGAGEPGRIMREQGRSISVNHQNSLVARAARTRDGAIANDVTLAPDFLPNPLLPETRSEMAIPLIVADQVIGVLDVQADTTNRFTADDVAIQSTLADQIAVAVQNARTFKTTQETAERLREVDRLKSQFLANMSHELRTPLNSIIGYAEVLLDGIDGELGDEAIEDVQAIHGGGKHLLTIINDILDLAKIEAGQMFMDRQEANLNQAVDEVLNTCNILAKNKSIGLTVEMDGEIPHVYGDPIRLKQIIFNLVNNSIKFTDKGGVTVNLGMTNNNEEVIIAVRDTGIGMTEQDITGLFQQFHQVDGSATRRAGGTGLGLVITRYLVQMHGGEIYVESEKGAGSTFWFTLPVYTNQPRQKA